MPASEHAGPPAFSVGPLGLYFLSALFYSLIPIAVAFWGLPSNSLDFAIAINALLSIGSLIPLTWFFRARLAHLQFLLKPNYIATLFFNAVTIFLSYYFLLEALKSEHKISVVLIVESWPILVSLLMPYVRINTIQPITLKGAAFSLVSLLGVAIVITRPDDWNQLGWEPVTDIYSMICAVLSMIFMAAATLVKGRFTEQVILKSDISPFLTQLILQVSLVLVWLPLLIFNPDAFSALGSSSATGVLAIALLHMGSGILYTFGYLSSKKSSDSLIWFFAPLFTALWLEFANFGHPLPHDILGGILIISSNLFINFPAQKGISYPSGVLVLILFGAYCFYFPGTQGNDVYSIVSTLSIFYVVIISFLLERVAQKIYSEGDDLINLWEALSETIGPADSDALRKARDYFLNFSSTANSDRLKENYDRLFALVEASKSEHAAIARSKLNGLAFSRSRGVSFGELFGLSGITLLTIAAAIHYRPNSHFGDIFGTITAFSVAFIYLSLIDLHRMRFSLAFRVEKHGNHQRLRTRTRVFSEDVEHLYWSVILIIFTASGLVYLFHFNYL